MQKRVYVIGAGAGVDINMPTGEDLKTIITNKTNIDTDVHETKIISGCKSIAETIKKSTVPNNPQEKYYQYRLSREIAKGMPLALSIDNYLDSHRDNEQKVRIGKIAIAKSILEAEKLSDLYVKPDDRYRTPLSFSNLRGTWYSRFFQAFFERCDSSQIVERLANTTIIIFN